MKMKEGGKVATIKKMKVGGNTSDSCFPLCLVDGECKKCTSTRIGDALVKAGAVLFGKKVLKDAKKKTAAKTEATQETVQKQKMGGATKKKYAMGGQTIVGMPGYNATTRPMQMRNGGAKYNNGGPTVPATTPTPGQQRVTTKSQTPSSFNQPVGSYKKGGATKNAKLAAVAPPRNKVTRADVLTRILKKKKKS